MDAELPLGNSDGYRNHFEKKRDVTVVVVDEVLNELVAVAETAQLSSQLAPACLHAAERLTLDSLACAYGGVYQPLPSIIRSFAESREKPQGCSVIGTPIKVEPELAAFVNSSMLRYLDLNDTYCSRQGLGHPSDFIPAAWIGAELANSSGRELLAGVLVGYEIYCRLVDAIPLTGSWDHAALGAVASAAAVSTVLGMSLPEVREAMSLALTPNMALLGSRLGDVSMWKGCASANACRNGVFAAILARHGVTGPPAPFQGRAGLLEAVGVSVDLVSLQRSEAVPVVLESQIKRYPSGYFSQSAVEAALEVRSDLGDGTDISNVEVGTSAWGRLFMAGDPEKWSPATRETADHSLPYVVSCALITGELNSGSFAKPILERGDIRDLLGKVSVVEDSRCSDVSPGAARVTISIGGGGRKESVVYYHRGHFKNPMSDAEIEEKFTDLALPALGPERCRSIIDATWALHGASTVRGFFDRISTLIA